MIHQDQLLSRLEDLCAQHHVAGAAVGLLHGDDLVTATTGIANATTGLPVVSQTLFAAGSVTKVFTASLVMGLVDDGLIELDAPVRAYLPEFTVGGDPRSAGVTVRMLLNHTSGLPGNFTFDIPKGPGTVEQFVSLLAGYPFNSPPGEYWSYSNAGLVTAGRVVEVVTGRTFNDALAERILRPLALNATSDTDELILRSAAVGHLVDESGANVVVPRFHLGTNAPSGSDLATDIAGLLAFGRLHLDRGVAADGKRVLSPEAVLAMQTVECALPWGIGYDEMGLGWTIRRTNAGRLLSHTGASAGQHSILTVLPDQCGAVAVLTNSTSGAAMYSQLVPELLESVFGVTSGTPDPPAPGVDIALEPLAGCYEADEGRVVVTLRDGELHLEHEIVNPAFADVMRLIVGSGGFPPPPATLQPYAADRRFLASNGMPVHFVGGDGVGSPPYVYVGRIYRRA